MSAPAAAAVAEEDAQPGRVAPPSTQAVLPSDAMALEFWPDQELESVLWAAGVPGQCRARCISEADLSRRVEGLAEVVLTPAAVLSNRGDIATCLEDAEARGDVGSEDFLARCYPAWDGAALRVPLREGMAASDSEQSRFTLITASMPEELPVVSDAAVLVVGSEGEEEASGSGGSPEVQITGKEPYIGASPALVALREACRIMHEQNQSWVHRARCILSIGAHSDASSIGDAGNAARLAGLVARLVRFTFADGVELNFNHVQDHRVYYRGEVDNGVAEDEVGAFAAFVRHLRAELDVLQSLWADHARTDLAWMRLAAPSAASAAGEGDDYYAKNVRHLEAFLSKVTDPAESRRAWAQHKRDPYSPKPSPYHLSIAWDVRQNAFVPHDDPVNFAIVVQDVSGADGEEEAEIGETAQDIGAEEPAHPEEAPAAPEKAPATKKKKTSSGFGILKSLGAMLGVPSLLKPKVQRPPQPQPTARPTAAPTAEAPPPPDSEVLGIVPSSLPDDTDGDGVPVWGLIAESVDEVRCLASLGPVLGASAAVGHMTFTPETRGTPRLPAGDAASRHLLLQPQMLHLHKTDGTDLKGKLGGDEGKDAPLATKLSLGSLLSNMIGVGGVPERVARVLVQPHLLLPDTDAVDLLDVDVEGMPASELMHSEMLTRAASAVGRARELDRMAADMSEAEREEEALRHLEAVAAFEESANGDARRQLKSKSAFRSARRRRVAREHRTDRHGMSGVVLRGAGDGGHSSTRPAGNREGGGSVGGLAYLDLRAPVMRLVPVLSAQVRRPE